MKKKTVLSHLYGANNSLSQALLAAAYSEEVSPRQRERITALLRLNAAVVEDLKRRGK